MASIKDKQFHVFEGNELSIGEGTLPYVYKFKFDVYINQPKPLADPNTKLAFHVTMWHYDSDMERRKLIRGVRYYPLTKKLTKVSNKIEAPYVVGNQKDLMDALAREANAIITGKAKDSWDEATIKETIDATIESFCKKCGKDWGCTCDD